MRRWVLVTDISASDGTRAERAERFVDHPGVLLVSIAASVSSRTAPTAVAAGCRCGLRIRVVLRQPSLSICYRVLTHCLTNEGTVP